MLRNSSALYRCVLALAAAVLACAAGAAQAGTQASGAAALRTRFAATQPLLAGSPFGGPLVLESTEAPRLLQGDVYALVDHPFAAVSASLGNPERWCDVMILHLNTKYCRRSAEGGVPQIELRVGKKHDQPIAAASPVAFAFRANAGGMTDARGQYVKFGFKGMADITGMLKGGRRLEVECKRPGKLPTAEQNAFLFRVNDGGGFGCWVDSVERLDFLLRGLA